MAFFDAAPNVDNVGLLSMSTGRFFEFDEDEPVLCFLLGSCGVGAPRFSWRSTSESLKKKKV